MIKLDNKTMKKTQMSLQVVIMNTIIATIKVEQFVNSIPGCHHLYIMVEYQPGDSKVDDYPSAGLFSTLQIRRKQFKDTIFVLIYLREFRIY